MFSNSYSIPGPVNIINTSKRVRLNQVGQTNGILIIVRMSEHRGKITQVYYN